MAPWWSDEEWRELTAPDRCGMCADAHLEENEHSVLLGSTETTHVRLSRNQAHPGYALVILRVHETNLSDLSPDLLAAFWNDVQRAGRAIESVLGPKKIDYLVMGHRMPHLHCHLLPQHETDDPTRNVDISDGPLLLDDGELRDRAAALRSVWLRAAPPTERA
ncbi:HIT family protein [Streptomyces sp. AC495_CC817]|uniref:HIT family protein n=1 Tax=Streptomyces sp. AC495_CC817 TaxID=2823900 RepID=UPI001C2608FA|nr:HIT family protein [Streptomyces sp. AC495_CC817]